MLLDLDDATRVLGDLTEPLLQASGAGREGCVPNVVYTCGALIHRFTTLINLLSLSRIVCTSLRVGGSLIPSAPRSPPRHASRPPRPLRALQPLPATKRLLD